MDKKSFIVDYVLRRASSITAGFDGEVAAIRAAEAYDKIVQLTRAGQAQQRKD